MTSLQQKDTTFTKIFVGGLPYHTTDETLQRFFEPYGEIEEAVVITDRQTGKSRGYGFVTMSDREAAERACKDPNPIIDGRKANVNLAYLGAKPRIPVGELIAAFPYGLKTSLPSYFGGTEILGLPQVIYPSAYLPATPAASFTIAQPPHLLPATAAGGQIIDYATLAAAAAAAAGAGGYPATPLTSTAGPSCLALGADSLPAAFPYSIHTATGGIGGFFSGAAASPATATAYATLPYHAAGIFPTQTILGQLTTQPIPPQHVHSKLQ